jgi:hypothetical protein
MNAEQQQTAEQPPAKPEDKNGCGCNLEEIEQLACKAKRFEQQAKVMTEVAGNLDTYRQQYEDARQKYTDTRTAAVLDLGEIRTILDGLWEQLRCRLTDDQKACMKDASCEVFSDIAKCSDPPGCHSPCDDSEGPDPESQKDIGALAAEIARRRTNLTDSAAYFKALVQEPDVIKQQVGKLKADAGTLKNDVSAGGDSSKVPSLYASWLIIDYWANLDLTHIGHGFKTVAEYLDCLCSVLKCLVSGWTTVAILEGRLAELQCYEDARQKACIKKKSDTLHVIIDLYEECCRKKETPPEGANEKAPAAPAQQAPETPAQPAPEAK